jgi:hypothetical protein
MTEATDAQLSSPVVPLPGALPLFATGLGALALLGWRRKRKASQRSILPSSASHLNTV